MSLLDLLNRKNLARNFHKKVGIGRGGLWLLLASIIGSVAFVGLASTDFARNWDKISLHYNYILNKLPVIGPLISRQLAPYSDSTACL